MNTSAAIALASFDLAILGVLQNDNTVPRRLIGEQVNLSAPSVQRRIRRMEKSGVIAANTAVLDPGRTGRPLTIIVEMELVSETASGIDQIKRLFAETPQIQQCYYTAAYWLRLSGGQSMFGLLQHGKQGRFSMAAAVQPRADFLGDDLPRTVRKSEEADQTRQLLALPVIRDGCCASRPAARRALVTRKAPAKTPILTDEHRTALAATVEAGPKPDMDGIVRWRRVDLAQEEPGVPVSRQTPGRDLRAIGFAMRGRHEGSPARSTTRPSRRSTKRLRRRRPHPQPMGRQADRAPGSGRRPDGSEEQTHATPGAVGDAAPRAARSADRRGLSLRRPLPCQGQGRRAGHALVRHSPHG